MALHQIDHLVVVQVAGGGDHRVAGGVVRPHVVGQRMALHCADQRLGAERRPAHRLARISGFLEMVEDDVVGRVVRLADLLQDDAALALQLVGSERAVRQNVADDVGAEARSSFSSLT